MNFKSNALHTNILTTYINIIERKIIYKNQKLNKPLNIICLLKKLAEISMKYVKKPQSQM